VITAAAALGAAGCGSSDEPGSTVTVTVTETRASAQTPPARPAAARSTRAEQRASRPSVPPGYSRCDANIAVRTATTTCPFAQNTFYEYWRSGEAVNIDVYSPATGMTYATVCSRTGPGVRCATGDDGVVVFPQAAVDTYTDDQADRYARTAQLGPAPDVDDGAYGFSGNADGGGAGECDASYEGACLDPGSPDYDCEGGSGNGPDYTGEVRVVGDDHFDLDRDGNGIACES